MIPQNILKPCPFCDYPYAGVIKNGETLIGFTHIACARCEAQVIGGNFETAVKMWNNRPREDKDEEIMMRCFNKLTGIDADDWGDLRTILFERLRDQI